MPQHDLQDFLRTAELLEIKGLLKDDAAWPPQGLASLFQTAAPMSPTPTQKAPPTASLPSLPTVPVSSFLLPTGNATSIVSGPITESESPGIGQCSKVGPNHWLFFRSPDPGLGFTNQGSSFPARPTCLKDDTVNHQQYQQ